MARFSISESVGKEGKGKKEKGRKGWREGQNGKQERKKQCMDAEGGRVRRE